MQFLYRLYYKGTLQIRIYTLDSKVENSLHKLQQELLSYCMKVDKKFYASCYADY